MRRLTVAAAAVTVLAAITPHASAAAPAASDSPCALTAYLLNGGAGAGTLSGGPIGQTGTLTCTIQEGWLHSAPDLVSRSASGTGTTVLAPTQVTYPQAPTQPVYVCSSFSDGAATYYYDSGSGLWTTSITALCAPGATIDLTPLQEIADYEPGFPPAGFAVTSIGWVMTPGATAPAFLPPQSQASHPSTWGCEVSYTASTRLAHAKCAPAPGQEDPGFSGWSCYDPYVNVSLANTPGHAGESVRGTSSCGAAVAACTAITTAQQLSTTCSSWAGDGPAPFVCDADFSRASTDRTSTVRCATIDP